MRKASTATGRWTGQSTGPTRAESTCSSATAPSRVPRRGQSRIPRPEGITDARAALERSVALLLSTAPVVFKARGCITCHNQTLPIQAAVAARQKGIPIDEQLLETTLKQVLAFFKPLLRRRCRANSLRQHIAGGLRL